jgi:hypothetical protein
MQQFDIPIIQKTYVLYKSLHELQKTITKMERYSLWAKCQNTVLKTLEGLIRAGYMNQEQRHNQLLAVAVEVDLIRVFLRLSVDIKAVQLNKIIPIQQQVDEIGRMLGGWIKSCKAK